MGGWWFQIARFFNWISCNKGLKVKLLMFFFCLNSWGWNVLESERLLHSWHPIISWTNTKSTSMELDKWSQNVVIVENCNFLKVNCWFSLVIWPKWKQSVCFIILLYSSTILVQVVSTIFCSGDIKNSSMTGFLFDILLLFPNSNDLNRHE